MRLYSDESGHALGGRDQVNSEMHLEAMSEGVWRCNWRPRLNSEMHWEAVIERVSRCNWRSRSSELRDALGGCNQAGLDRQLEARME